MKRILIIVLLSTITISAISAEIIGLKHTNNGLQILVHEMV